MRNHFGKCVLCGRDCELTFEHIPPRAAFNSTPARPVSGTDLFNDDEKMPWDLDGLQYENQQRGMGRYTLCKTCNNNTGGWYADAYVNFSHITHAAMQENSPDSQKAIIFKELYPLRIIKQILSMFCSINPSEKSRFDAIRSFVLNKDAVGLDKTKYKVCMYFTDSNLMKYAGLSVLIKWSNEGANTMALSEITAYPFGFILYFNPTDAWEYKGIDITTFSDFGYDERVAIEFPWNIVEMNDVFPEDYRSKDEIIRCIERNKKL